MILQPLILAILGTFIGPNVAVEINPDNLGPTYPVPSLPGRGRSAIHYAFGGWRRAPMIYEPPIDIPIEKLATGNFKNLSNFLSGSLRLQNLTFYGMDDFEYEGYPDSQETQSYNREGVIGERWYGFFGLRVESMTGKAIFTGPKGSTTCNVVGLMRHTANGSKDRLWDRVWVRYDDSYVREPFKSVRLIQFDEYPGKKALSVLLYLDPECSGLNQRQLELFTMTTKAPIVSSSIRNLIINFMRKYYILHVIEPHRMFLEGRIN